MRSSPFLKSIHIQPVSRCALVASSRITHPEPSTWRTRDGLVWAICATAPELSRGLVVSSIAKVLGPGHAPPCVVAVHVGAQHNHLRITSQALLAVCWQLKGKAQSALQCINQGVDTQRALGFVHPHLVASHRSALKQACRFAKATRLTLLVFRPARFLGVDTATGMSNPTRQPASLIVSSPAEAIRSLTLV